MKNSNCYHDLGVRGHRLLLTMDDNFTFGHYQVGSNWKLDEDKIVDNKDVGYATIGGVRVGNELFYSVALCSPKNNFSRKEGRSKALEHMREDKHSKKRSKVDISCVVDAPPPVVLKYALEHHLQRRVNLPPWTRQTVMFINSDVTKPTKRQMAALKAWQTRKKLKTSAA